MIKFLRTNKLATFFISELLGFIFFAFIAYYNSLFIFHLDMINGQDYAATSDIFFKFIFYCCLLGLVIFGFSFILFDFYKFDKHHDQSMADLELANKLIKEGRREEAKEFLENLNQDYKSPFEETEKSMPYFLRLTLCGCLVLLFFPMGLLNDHYVVYIPKKLGYSLCQRDDGSRNSLNVLYTRSNELCERYTDSEKTVKDFMRS
ncbi:MAG: hypothetical protein AAF244_03325 [Pseudomonadota bacterium]